ncbi:uncharacterized protein LOC115427887 [Sphaeramia orbicularis]|uniref:uncharacterized protein LOC115427887 n=1 Tax=Sphaeramia orbicularis TaxID=375764 RepID=UPI001181377C|nr:uncharacterized protein LOC115427887 [Sphaeramia orbicularis]
MKAGTEQLDPLPPNWRSEESAAEDPDGKPLEMEDEDPELIRKRRELKAIEEKILLKKAAIALKMVNPFAKRMTLPELSCDEQSAKCDGTTLRDRVNAILHQHHPPNYKRSKVHSKSGQRDKINPSFPRQADHPLKLRVYSLLRRRCPDPHVVPPNSEVLDVLPPLPPSQSFTTPPEEENGVNKGFLRFLEVLNKGVDLNVLSRIVNNDGDVLASPDEMLNNELSVVESNSDVACTTKSQTTSSGANPLRSSWTSSGERRTVSQERSHNDRRSLPIEEEEEKKTNDRGGHTLSTRSPSKSPPPKVKKKEEDEKEKAKMDERQEQLQNILKTLGFSLEADEMSRLADRTQERLYGRKPSGNQRPDSQENDSHRCDGHSSSSFSTSSPSKSVCSSSSPHRDSHKREQTSHKGSDVQDVYEDDEESQSHQTDSSPAQPTASSQDTILFQLSQYNAYYNGIHGSPTDVDSTYAQGESHPSKHSFIGFTYPQNTLQHSPFPVTQPHKPNVQPHNYNTWGRFNPDLSMSEGQTGLIKGPRCLTLVQNSVKVKKKMKNQIERRLLNCESFSPFPSSSL